MPLSAKPVALPFVLAAVLGAVALPAAATQVNTGDAGAPYDASFCPVLIGQLKLAQFDYRCATSAGTRENMERVLADPRQLGYAQLDAYAIESQQLKVGTALTVVRQDDVRECVFAVTRNRDISNYGELAANAGKLRFILPPANSGSASTFQFLRAIDADGIGRAKSVTNAASTEDSIREALSADDTVSLFVQFADPDSERFELVRKLGGHVVPVIDRTILRQEIGAKKIYFAQETQVESGQWTRSARKIVTACTPLVVFTGSPERVSGDQARKDHQDLIRTVSAIPAASLLPEQSAFQRFLRRTKEISATSTEKLLEVTDQARETAKPYTEKAIDAAKEASEQARQAAERAAEAAKPYYDKSKEAAQKAFEDARRVAKDMIEKSKPDAEPKKD